MPQVPTLRVRVCIQEQRDRFATPCLDSEAKAALQVDVNGVDVSAGSEQGGHDFGVPVEAGHLQDRQVALVV